jgi:hypothetical protein
MRNSEKDSINIICNVCSTKLVSRYNYNIFEDICCFKCKELIWAFKNHLNISLNKKYCRHGNIIGNCFDCEE